MDKQTRREHEPLFRAGFTDIDLDSLEEHFVDSFQSRARRRYLIERLRAFLLYLSGRFSLDFEVWIDGSFCTRKPAPDDVDLVLFFPPAQVAALTPEDQRAFFHTANAMEETLIRYACDAYFLEDDDPALREFWEGWFGSSMTGRAKGIARVTLRRGHVDRSA